MTPKCGGLPPNAGDIVGLAGPQVLFLPEGR